MGGAPGSLTCQAGAPQLGPVPLKAAFATLWHWGHFKGSNKVRSDTKDGLELLVDG